MIRLEAVRARLGTFELQDVSLEVPSGGYGLLIGPTGSGKTSVLEAIAGHVRLRHGRVFLDGKDVTRIPPEHRGVGVVYQQNDLFPHLNVRDNIRYGLAHSDLSGADQQARVADLAEGLGLTPLLHRGTASLSGGEAQRVGLARALAPRPSILLLDEPFAALDPHTRVSLKHQLLDIHLREGVTTLQVTHDFQEALQLGERVAVMDRGRIVQHGTPEEVFRRPDSAFIARFAGAANVIEGSVRRTGPDSATLPFPAVFTAGDLTLEVLAEREGPANAIIHGEDITISRDTPTGSALNQLPATVSSVEEAGPITHVDLAGAHLLRAAVTAVSARRLGLHAGVKVMATIKATAIRLV